MAKATPASEWKNANRKVVELPSGRAVEIRKLTAEFLLESREVLESAITAGAGSATLKLSAQQYQMHIDVMVRHSVVRPRVVAPDKELGENEMVTLDFGPDLDPLVAAIQDFNPEVLEAPFRAAAVGADAAPGGGDVRNETEPAPAGDAGGPDAGHGCAEPGGGASDVGTQLG